MTGPESPGPAGVSGPPPSSVVHHVLSEPVYKGIAYANRFNYVVPAEPRSRTRRSPDQWIAIPAPVLVDRPAWEAVQARLARNAVTSFRRNKKFNYLLRCLLKCGSCGLGPHGCCFPAQNGRPARRYYRCTGNDPLNAGRDTNCPRARIDADALEQAVWDHVADLLGDLDRLLA